MLKKILLTLGLSFSLIACSHTQPGIEVQVVEKPIIKIEKCIKKEDVPSPPASLASEGTPSDLKDAVRKALAKIAEWTKYGQQMDVIVKQCTAE